MRYTSNKLALLLIAGAILGTLFVVEATESKHLRVDEKVQVQNGNLNLLNDYVVVNTYQDSTLYWALLHYTGSEDTYMKPRNPIIKYLNFSFTFQSSQKFNVRIDDAELRRWEIPKGEPFSHDPPGTQNIPFAYGLVSLQVTSSPFSFAVVRNFTGETLFNTSVGNFIYSDLYIEISTSIPRKNIYGFGERAYYLQLPSGTYTMWNKDQYAVLGTNSSGSQTYGSHPVYLLHEQAGNFDMVYLRNSNAMDVVIDTENQLLTFKVVGGILDFQFFLGDKSPETAVRAYHSFIGGWTVQPFWSFGWHQSKYGYPNATVLEDVVKNYTKNSLPLDVIWSDIDYLDHALDFTTDPDNFPAANITRMLAEQKKRWVPIIEVAVGINATYQYYQKGLAADIFAKNANYDNLQVKVWSNLSHYIDYSHPNAEEYWAEGLAALHQMVPFSGLWLDMNEPSNFCDGDCRDTAPADIAYNDLPYTPGVLPLVNKTMSLDAKHFGGIDHYNVHNFYGFLESRATYNYLTQLSPLAFSLTRANAPGTGKYSAHWTGDNAADYDFLKFSVAQIMSFNIFGIPNTGADICGFVGEATEDLCARWIQLGAFYPFARDHHSNDELNQAPYALGPTVLETARVSIKQRYALLKHYYGLFLERQGRGTVFRPLFFEFPNDTNLYDSQAGYSETQFMLGSSLLVAPALFNNGGNVTLYLPKARWYDFNNRNLVQDVDDTPQPKTITSPLNQSAPAFIRGGWAIASQDVTKVLRTDDLDNKFILNIALDPSTGMGSRRAQGKMMSLANMSDQNVYNKCMQTTCIVDIDVTDVIGGNGLFMQFKVEGAQNVDPFVISKITVYGSNDVTYYASISTNGTVFDSVDFQQDEKTNSFTVTIPGGITVTPPQWIQIDYDSPE